MSELTVRRIAEDVCAAPQIAPQDLKAIAAAGFRSVVNNRPDFEGGPAQPTAAALEAEAHAAGLAYAHLPVQSAFQTPEQAAEMRRLLDTLPRPILMFCRSGTRSARLYDAAQAL